MDTRRIARVVTGGIVGGAAVMVLASCGDMITDSASDDATIRESITAVRFATDAGNVTIRTGETTAVHRTVHYNGERPGTTHKVDGDTLVLESCPERNCWIDYEVVVPDGTAVSGSVGSGDVAVTGLASANISSGSGDAAVRGVAGAVNVEAGSGEVTLDDIGDDVAVRTGSGDVTVTNTRAAVTMVVGSGDVRASGLGGAATVESGSGGVTLTLASPQDVQVTAQSGDVKVVVPDDTYRVELDSSSGDIESAVENDPSGTHTIDVTTASGEIDVERA